MTWLMSKAAHGCTENVAPDGNAATAFSESRIAAGNRSWCTWSSARSASNEGYEGDAAASSIASTVAAQGASAYPGTELYRKNQ